MFFSLNQCYVIIAQMCLLIGNVSQVSNMAYGPLLICKKIFFLFLRKKSKIIHMKSIGQCRVIKWETMLQMGNHALNGKPCFKWETLTLHNIKI